MKSYLFDVEFKQKNVLLDQPLRMIQPAESLSEAWYAILEFEFTCWGEALISIKFVGIED